MDRLSFEFIGRYKRENTADGFSIVVGERPPVLNHALVPKELNSLKEFDREDWIDLKEGIENFEDDGDGEKLETVLQFVEKMDSEERNLRKRIGCDFLCGRGLMSEIALSISPNRTHALKFRAVKLKNVIFMCVIWENRCEEYYDFWNILSYTSRNFETKVVVNPDFQDESGTTRKVTNAVGYKVINRVKIGDWRGKNPMMVFSAADVDATEFDANFPDSGGSDVSVSTMVGVRSTYFIENKSLRVYMNASLGNIKTLVVGHKNEKQNIWKLHGNDRVRACRISREDAETKVYCYAIEKISTETLRQHPDFVFNVNHNVDILYDVFKKLKDEYLLENGMAVEFEKFEGRRIRRVQDFAIRRIPIEKCDFVPEEFLNKFD